MGRRVIKNGVAKFVDLNQVDYSDLKILIDAVLSNSNLGSHSQPYNSSWYKNIEPLGWNTYDKFKFLLITLEDIPLALGTGKGWTSNDGNGNYALGFGFDPYRRRETLYRDLVAAGVALPNDPALIDRLRKASSLSQSSMNTLMSDLFTGREISFAQAANLFSVIDDGIEQQVDGWYKNLPASIERAVVFDLKYNGYVLPPSYGNGSPNDNYQVELYNLLDKGDFVGAAVKLALTDGSAINHGAYQRDVTRARVLLYSQMLTDNSGLLAPAYDIMDVLPALSGQPLNVPITDKALQTSLDLAATLQARLGAIQAWEASVNASGDVQRINARNAFLSDALTQSRRVLEAHGFHLNSGQSTSLSQAAAAAHVPAAHLQTIYGNRTFAAYEVFLVPYGMPSEIAGDGTLAGMAPAANGQRRVVKYDHDSNNFVTFITKAAVGDPALTFVNQSDRTLMAVENPATVVGYERVGNGYRVRMVDGDSILVTSTSESSGEHVRAEYTNGTGGPPVIINVDPDRPLAVGSQGSLFFRNNYYGGQWAAQDFENVPGISNAYLLAKILGRADAPEGMGGEGPPIALEDIIDPDGEVFYEVRINPDGTKESVTTFYLNNGSTGLGDRVVQVTKQSVFGGEDVTTYSSVTRFGDDATVTYVREQAPSQGPIELLHPKVDIVFEDKILTLEQFGSIFGSSIGRYLGGSNVAAQIALGAVLSTVSGNLGEIADNLLNDVYGVDEVTPLSAATKIDEALDDIGSEFLQNLRSAGAGALSSFLLSEIFEAVGIGGLPGELSQTIGGAYLSAAIEALPELLNGTTNFSAVFKGIDPLSIAASWLGSTLASEIAEFDTIGGQLGSSIGAAVGAVAGSAIAIKALGLGAALGGPIGALVGAFVGFLGGGLIGSVFGGTPRSGADVAWDASTGEFTVANAYARKGGSKEAAQSVSEAVANIYNSVLQATEAKLLAPDAVQPGNYGMRKKEWVYRGASTQAESAIEAKFQNPDELIAYGTAKGLKDIVANAAGGNVYVKRALFNALDASDGAADGRLSNAKGAFSVEQVVGVISVARDYAMFAENASIIATAIANDPHSNFALGWATTLAMAADLHLDRRAVTDWTGGYAVWLDELNDGKFDDVAVAASAVEMNFNTTTNGREWLISGGTGKYRGTLTDDIAVDKQTVINGASDPSGGDFIDLRTGMFAGAAIEVAAVVFANNGHDLVHASNLGDSVSGGAGDDTLYGGSLDDWLFGDAGNDTLNAGGVTPGTVGGDGNYLDGGAGNDVLFGREGADWLEGGYGTDQLDGGAGDDVLAGGGGAGDLARGGAGADQYIFRRGDGQDTLSDESDAALGRGAIGTRLAAIATGSAQRNWAGDGTASQVLGASGEDAIVFGEGIDFRDLILRRSTVGSQPGADLIIEVTQRDANGAAVPTGDVLTIRNWFDETRRIEWLKFVDGTEVRIGDVSSFIIGTSGDDVLIGTLGADFLLGGDGNDVLRGLAGDDFGFGGRGKDFVAGDADDDWVLGGDDDDQVIGGWGDDTVFGDQGNDTVYGSDGNDLVVGGRGDDRVIGGAGNDVIRFLRGDGRDTVSDEYAQNWELVWSQGAYVNGYALNADGNVVKAGVTYFQAGSWNGTYDWRDQEQRFYRNTGGTSVNAGDDTLEFGLNIDIGDIQLRRNGADLQMAIGDDSSSTFNAIADSLTLKDWYTLGTPIEHFVFIEVGKLDVAGWSIGAIVTDGDDVVQGGSSVDWITGGLGNDQISGGAANDILGGNHGADTLKGEAGADILFGGAGNDVLEGGAGADELNGGSGVDFVSYAASATAVKASLAFAAVNTGEAIGDRYLDIEGLEGGTGADELSGDAADNILRGLGGNDRLRGGAGDDVYEIGLPDGNDVIDDGATSVEQVLDQAGNLNTAAYAATWEYLGTQASFGNWRSYRLTVRRISDGAIVYASRDGVDFLYSSAQSAAPSGTAWPFADGQWKLGGARTGSGVQTILMADVAGNGGDDTLEFNAGIGLSDLTAAWENGGTDLRLNISGGGTVLLKGQSSADKRIEAAVFADGLMIDLATLRHGSAAAGSGSDLFLGGSGADDFNGGAGDDVIGGGIGNDVLVGGDGNDVLEGGAGADVLTGGADSTSADHAAIGSNPTGAYGDTIRYTESQTAVTINLLNSTALGGDADGDVISGIENVVGSDLGADFLQGSDGANRLSGLGGNDVLLGNGGDDVISGGAGADSIQGNDGHDAITGDAGNDYLNGQTGNDTISGGDERDDISGGEGDDTLNGDDGNDLLYGDGGKDKLSGGSSDDTLYGGDGNDTLVGGDGYDVLYGDAGDDTFIGGHDETLVGGLGDDVYVFEADTGYSEIVDGDGSNRIVLSKASFDRVWFEKDGGDLVVGVVGTDLHIYISGYFAATGGSPVHSVSTATHTIYLDHAAPLIAAMAAQGRRPHVMPPVITAELANYWHLGDKAPPRVSDQVLATSEDVPLVGAVNAIDHDGNVVGHAIVTAPAHGIVDLNATTGAWIFTPIANWSGSDGFQISVTDAHGQTALQQVAVTVSAVNDQPDFLPVALSVSEHAANGAVVGTLLASDVDNDAATLRYTLTENAGGRFAITSEGVLLVNRTPEQVASGRVLDRETAPSHVIRVLATDAGGATREQEFSVDVADVNERPHNIVADRQLTFAENGPLGSSLASFAGSDPEGNVTSFLLMDDAGGLFALTSSGQLKVGAQGLNYEAGATASIVVRATDAGGLSFDKSFTITIGNVNEKPTDLAADGPLLFNENLGVGTGLVRFSGVDPEANILSYSLTENAGGRFAISASGQLTVGTVLDYEAGANFSITVRATDAGGLTYDEVFAVALANVNEAPTDLVANQLLSFQENTAVGSILAAFSAVDPEANATSYTLMDNADGRFTLTSSGQLKVGAAGLDYEAGPSKTIIVRATDALGLTYDEAFTVAITNVNEAPTGISADVPLTFNENLAAGTALATFTGTDPEDATISLTLSTDAAGRFTLDAQGVLRVGAAGLNYEAGSAQTITLRAKDAAGLTLDKSFTVTIGNLNEAPVDLTADRVLAFNENLAVGTVLANFTGADPENNVAAYTLLNDAGGRFALTSGGQLKVGAAGLDHEAAALPSIIVRVTDANGLTYDETFTVTVNNVNEAPAAITAPAMMVLENAAVGTVVGLVTASDPDTAAANLVFSLDNSTSGRFAITASGQLQVAGALNYEAGASQNVIVRVTDAGGLYLIKTVQVGVGDVNEAPTAIALAPSGASVTERDRIGDEPAPPAINLGTLSGTDPDLATSGDFATLAFSVADARFEILSGNQLWLKAGAMPGIDFESSQTLSVAVTVKDKGGATGALSYTRNFSFGVLDRDDVLVGTAGVDNLVGQSGRDILRGQGAGDTLNGASGNDDLYGGDGADTLYGQAGNDILFGELDNDTLDAGIGDDVLDGGDGNDTLRGADGLDTLTGGGGLDTLYGGNGADQLGGGADKDALYGEAGVDRLDGGAGDDTLTGGVAADRLLGGEGFDIVSYADATSGIAINLELGTGTLGDALGDVFEDRPEQVTGSAFADQITGSAARDIVYGGSGDDTIYGGAGDDELYGGAGNDYIDAQAGGDLLDGDAGNDVLIGGTGSDTYLIRATSGMDEIRNFDPNGTDIDVIGYQGVNRAALWFERSADDLVISAIGTSAVTTVKNYYQTAAAGDLANFKIDFIIAGAQQTDIVNVAGLVTLMAGYTKPVDAAAYNSLHTNLAFENQWRNYWDENGAPTISDPGAQTIAEDSYASAGFNLALKVTDDVTPVTGMTISVAAVRPDNSSILDSTIVQSVSIGGPDASGNRVLNIRTQPNASGAAAIRITAVDPGGLASERIIQLNVTPTADAPIVAAAQPVSPTAPLTKPTLDSGSWALNVQAALADQDGSETLEVRISNLPAGFSFDRGANLTGGVWSFTPPQLVGLKLVGPASWSQDLALTVTAISREKATGATASTSAMLNMAINARPTDLVPDRAVTVNEKAAAAALVANFATSDADTGDTRAYALTNNAGGRFQINATTGALTVLNGTLLDFEAAASHGIVVRVTDSGGLFYDEAFTVTLANVNEAPTDLNVDRALSFTENLAVGAALANFGGVDPEANIASYSLVNNAGGRVAITAAGQLQVGATGLNYEGGPTQTIVVRATDAGGLIYDESFTFTITNVNERPTDVISNVPLAFSENIAVGTVVATLSGVDPESNVASYSLINDAGGRFTLASNGQLKIGQTGLNFEAGASVSIIVRATDAAGLTFDKTLSISINNLNEAPVDVVPSGLLSVAENTAAGTVVASFAAVDPDSNFATLTLVNNAGGQFTLDANGTLKVGTSALNYEAGGSATIVIRATDTAGLTYDEAFTVGIANVNERPVDIWPGTALTFAENTPVGTGLVWFGSSDPEGNIASYALVDGAGGRFALDANGLLKVGAAGLNFEAGASGAIIVRVTDTAGLTYDEAFTFGITNVNEAPTNITAGGALTFSENLAIGSGLVSFTGSDPDGNVTGYSLTESAGGRFALDASGQLKVGAAGLNYEGGSSHTIVVRTTDALGLTFDKAFAVTIGNLNEAPTDIWADRTLAFDENLGIGVGLAWFGSSDPEGNVATYSIVNDTGGRFTMRSDGLLIVGSAGLNFEGGASTPIVVRVTDSAGLSYDEALTVSTNNLNEAPSDIWADRTLSFNENLGVGTGLAWFGSSDPEGNVSTYSLASDAGGRFAIDANGLLKVGANGLNFEAGGNPTIVVRVADSAGLAYEEAFTVNIGNLNEAPTDIWADRVLSFDENTGVGTGLAWFGGADPESNISAYSLVNDAGGRFSMRADGLLLVGASGLNYEGGAPIQPILVRATDVSGAVYDEWFNVEIRNLNEAPTVSASSLSINENAAPGTIVGPSISFGDPDGLGTANGKLSLALTGIGAENFFIDSAGTITFHQGSLYDQDVAGSSIAYNLTVTVRDQVDPSIYASAPVTIAVNSVNEAPRLTSVAAHVFSAGVAFYGYQTILTVNAHDPENSTISYSAVRTASSLPGVMFSPTYWSGWGAAWAVYRGASPSTYSAQFEITASDGVSSPQPYRVTLSGASASIGPVVLDLDGDGLELTSLADHTILFDMNGDGSADPTGWVGSDDALLVLDRNRNGSIDDGTEIAFTDDQVGAFSDLEGLRSYDSNQNGFFDATDAEFASFRLWRDLNQDGISQAGELITLNEQGIAAINLTLNVTSDADEAAEDNVIHGTTEFTKTDGTVGTVGDVFLAYQTVKVDIEEPGAEGSTPPTTPMPMSALRMSADTLLFGREADVSDTPAAQAVPDPVDLQLILMRQAMNSFTVGGAEIDRLRPQSETTLDYFASAA